MIPSRRQVLQAAIALPASAALLAACSAINPNATPTENMINVTTDVNDIAGAFAKELPAFSTIKGITPQIISDVTAKIDEMQAVDGALTQAASTTAAQPLVQKIEADVNAVVDAVALLPLPPAIAAIFQAATILLPIIEASVGLMITPAAAAKAKAVRMSPDEARAVLRLTSLSR